MKKPYTFGILVTTALMAAFALCSRAAYAQAVEFKPATVIGKSPPFEQFKVEGNCTWIKQPFGGADANDSWTNFGPNTVGTAAKALCALHPGTTIAVDPTVGHETVTNVMIRANDVSTELELLRVACGGLFQVHQIGNQAFTLESNAQYRPAPPKPDRAIECFNLMGYLLGKVSSAKGEKQNSTDLALANLREIILTSIHIFDPAMPDPQFQFYRDGQLFIVIGPQRAIDIAAKIIHAGDSLNFDHTKP
ncbi:MAG TPA: hypothetical protein VFC44_20180 [Candidatus Saccharimonadales bacterium]|nr:hypothetical protein [Candidatus Saccharimonadales bacterium]